MSKKQNIKGINIIQEKPDNWDKIKDGFTQAMGCKNCGNRWTHQLEWGDVAVNSVIMYDYCTECYKGVNK